jgi:ABC-type transporter MlaC component
LDAGALDFRQRADRLGPVPDQAYDLDFMARKPLGSAYDKLDADRQKRWIAVFRAFMIANYAGRLCAYHQQSFELRGEEPSTRETVLVKGASSSPAPRRSTSSTACARPALDGA